MTRASGFWHFAFKPPASLALAVLFLSPNAAPALTLAELQADKALTPARLIQYFANFKFELNRDVRGPEIFLKAQAGDCNDFATLAASILREKGYTPRLVAVFMPHDVHVVCYVQEAGGYLDYNRRKMPDPLVKCKSDLSSIAASVAESFKVSWRSASEFTFKNETREFVSTEFQ